MNKKIGADDLPNIVISLQYLLKREGRDTDACLTMPGMPS